MSSTAKLEEAQFFLELLDALEKRKRPITNDATASQEASYLLSAILNALYSALEQSKPILGVDMVKSYKAARPSLFGGQGFRNITIHERHIEVDHSGYIPTVNFSLHKTPRLISEEQDASKDTIFYIGSTHYIEVDGKLIHIATLCFKQFYELREFFITHGVVT